MLRIDLAASPGGGPADPLMPTGIFSEKLLVAIA
jgi:hypothetical protein